MSQILDNIFLGSVEDENDGEQLKKKKITHILVVGKELKPSFPN